jgi:hypothetical protein
LNRAADLVRSRRSTSAGQLKSIWLVAPKQRLRDGEPVCAMDEAFHGMLVAATGNREMARCHQ